MRYVAKLNMWRRHQVAFAIEKFHNLKTT